MRSPKPVDFSKPPDGYSKAKLFRALIQRPRPTWPLKFRVRGAEHIALHIVSLKTIEMAELSDNLDAIEHDAVRKYEGCARLISLFVHTPKGLAFRCSDDVLHLSEGEIDELLEDLMVAVHHCSPTYRRSDEPAWKLALREGAEHHTNFYEAASMYRACDRIGSEGAVVDRPDKYYGLPMCELTDGQLMVFSAAVESIKIALRSTDG